MPEFDTVILAGGKAARMAGADKPGLAVGGVPMLASVALAAAAAGTRRLIVVGPERAGPVRDALLRAGTGLPGGLALVREEPPGGGPVRALRRGLAEVVSPWLALLAADLPFLTGPVLADLVGALAVTAGAVLADDDGRPQWLAGAWRADVLRGAVADYQGSSLGGLLAPLEPRLASPAAGSPAGDNPEARGGMPPWLDCDTPEDLAAARAVFRQETGFGRETMSGPETASGREPGRGTERDEHAR